MSGYALVTNCTLDDAAGLAKIHVTQNWDKPWFKAAWGDHSLEEVIRSSALGYRKVLTDNRDITRHQKVVHTATGEIVGYARWYFVTQEPAGNKWREAKGPNVSQNRLEEINRVHQDDPVTIDFAYWQALKGPIVELYDQNTPPQPYLRLDLLNVSPNHRGGQVERLLLQSGIAAADVFDLVVYTRIDAGYDKEEVEGLGFELVASHTQHLSEDWNVADIYSADVLIKYPTRGWPSPPR